MKNSINLNSSEWCDMVFENKNKAYGAYALRQTSGKRHYLAFGVIIVLVAILSVLPAIINTVKASVDSNKGGIEDEYVISKLPVEIPIVEIPETTHPTPVQEKPLATIQFAPPVITEDNLVETDKTLKDMKDVIQSDLTVGNFDVPDGSLDKKARPIEDIIITEPEPESKSKVFVTAEVNPQFPGGVKEMYKYIGSRLRYPVVAQESNIQGTVVVRFVVGTEGEIKDVEVLRGIDVACDKEAITVVKSMPKWIPGKQNGHPVQVYFTLPITFKLN